MKGRFITIEGGEGSGKSTQLRLLMDAFSRAGLTAIQTREPGGTEGAETIRNLLLQGAADKWDDITETLLFYAARREHLVRTVWPEMEQGRHVICDRFADSTRVYQGYAKGLGDAYIVALHHLTVGNFQPDLTLWLDIDAGKGLQRAISRPDETEMRFESMQASFHDKVRNGFEHLLHNEPERIMRIDANQSIEAVHRQIISVLNAHLGFALQPRAEHA